MTKTTDPAGTALEHRIGPRGRFILRQSSGEVAVQGVEGDTVRVHSLDGRELSDLFSVETSDDAVELRQIERFGFRRAATSRREGAELSVQVPHGATVSVETQSADIEASDLSGTKVFRTASGELTLRRLAGGLEVETVSGEIELDGNAPIDLVAKSVSGDVEVRVPSVRRLDLGTTSGDVRMDAALAGEGPFAIRSISGDVTIVGRSGVRVEAESITGDLSSDLPSKRESMPGRKVLVVGKAGPTLTFRSVSGDFHVVEPRDAGPAPVEPPSPASPPEPPQAPEPPESPPTPTGLRTSSRADSSAEADATRLEILRALERGDITVAEATDQLSQIDEVLR